MKTSALKARITSFSRRGAEGKRCARPPHRTASLVIFICSLFRYRRLFIARNRDTRRENIALPMEGRRRRERKGERKAKRKEGKPFCFFRFRHLGEREFRYGSSRKKHNVYCTTHCIDVSKICVAVNCVKTNVPILCLSLSLSFEFRCPRC